MVTHAKKTLFAKTAGRHAAGCSSGGFRALAGLLRAVGEVERAAFGRHAAVAPRRELLGAGGRAGDVVHLQAVLGAGDGALHALLPLPQQQHTCRVTTTAHSERNVQ